MVDSIGAYLAGGLSPDERQRFEAAVASLCAACAAAVAELERADAQMRDLFAGVHPAGRFEDEIVDALRDAPLPMPVAGAAAAARREAAAVAQGQAAAPARSSTPWSAWPRPASPRRWCSGRWVRGHARDEGRQLAVRRRLRFVDGRLRWDSGSGNDSGPAAASNNVRQHGAAGADGAAVSRDGRNASPVEYKDVKAKSPSPVRRRWVREMLRGLSGGWEAHPGSPYGGATRREAIRVRREAQDWYEQKGKDQNNWAMHYKENGKFGEVAGNTV